MDISIYKNKLLNEGFLNIKLDELYPDLVDTIQIFNNKEEYIQRLSNIQFDSIIFSDITYEYIKSLYCSNSDLINEERINIKEIEGNSHKKFTFKLKLKNPNYKFLYDLNNQLKKISSQVFQSWIDTSIYPSELEYSIFYNLMNKIYLDFYGMHIKFGDVHPTFTCFQDGDFILSHKDADDTENRCVVLLYLNSDYEDGLGGELIIQNKEVVKPEFGRIAILDFTNNNVIHEVTPVQGNFKRCALISFN
jgi:Rps23 Pro-64 3,4-dihydroxylase Tpa1-like proline 4-hydroxylase